LTALAARGLEHLATGSASGTTAAPATVASPTAAAATGTALRHTRRTTLGATVRLILEAFARKKLLLA
jgi:hypothetical protein